MRLSLAVLLVAVMLLVACGAERQEVEATEPLPEPTNTPEPTVVPTEAPPADQIVEVAALIGVWEGSIAGEKGYILYTDDGHFQVALLLDTLVESPRVRGRYWFEGGLIHLQDEENIGHWAACDTVGVYLVRLLDDGQIQFEPEDEACETGGFTRRYVFSSMVQKRIGDLASLTGAETP